MAGRKSSTQNQPISPGGSPPSDDDSAAAAGGGGGISKEQDRLLPIANVSRIMKKSLPSNAKISKEAKETVQECVSEFINFITGEASDKCLREKRKTINGDDLLWAMNTLGFDSYVVPLKSYLSRYKESGDEKNSMMTEEGSGGGGGEIGIGGLYKGPAGPAGSGFGGGNGFYGRSDGGRGSFHGVHW